MADYAAFLRAHQLILAPMAGVSDAVMRQLCIEQGARLAFTEMVSAKGLSYGSQRTRDLVSFAPNEERAGVQLFGHEPETMADMARALEQALGEKLAVIDINMGCPARKIVKKGDGSALMKDPVLAGRIVEAVAGAVSVPVSVKMRRGYESGRETAPELARTVEEAGAAAVTVHGRFAAQLYRGAADWGSIARVKQAVGIPVVGNGDITSGAALLRMRAETGCDAFMVARAAEGNPWVFAELSAALEGRPAPAAPTCEERVAMARRHAHLVYEREPRALPRMRKQGCWYAKGLPEASEARAELNRCTTIDDFDRAFDRMLERIAAAREREEGAAVPGTAVESAGSDEREDRLSGSGAGADAAAGAAGRAGA